MPKTYPDVGTYTSGQILTAASMNDVGTNLDNFRVPAMCRAKRSGDLTGYSSNTAIAWNAEDFDTDGMHDNVTNNTRVTINTAGIYVVTAGVYIAYTGTATAASILVRRTRSASTLTCAENDWYGSRATDFVMCASGTLECQVNDYFEVNMVLTGGTSLIVKDALQCFLALTWVGTTA